MRQRQRETTSFSHFYLYDCFEDMRPPKVSIANLLQAEELC